ncbi:MAG TPA: LLM class flavin-dependent oxidoreductase [Isosphaeraceae bacterium]|jgi:luciferase family oxidoreductase group 1
MLEPEGREHGTRAVRLGILDQAPIPAGAGGAEALAHSLDLARLADRLGYHRYWVAEHHNSPGLACASPEVLIGPIAAATTLLRVGSGGVMLPHYSPLKVAESFAMLAALYPGRIDLGLGRAPGSDPATAFALQRDRRRAAPDDFPEQLGELLGYFQGRTPAEGPLLWPPALPGLPHRPEPWLLGSSPQSALWAADFGLPYAFADFINPAGAPLAAAYRARAGAAGGAPRVIVAAGAICAETDAEAQRLAASVRMMLALLHRGRLVAVPPVEEALQFLAEQPDALPRGRRLIVGDPGVVRSQILALADEYAAEEVLIVTIVHEHAARRRSYERIADAFGLPGPDGAAGA